MCVASSSQVYSSSSARSSCRLLEYWREVVVVVQGRNMYKSLSKIPTSNNDNFSLEPSVLIQIFQSILGYLFLKVFESLRSEIWSLHSCTIIIGPYNLSSLLLLELSFVSFTLELQSVVSTVHPLQRVVRKGPHHRGDHKTLHLPQCWVPAIRHRLLPALISSSKLRWRCSGLHGPWWLPCHYQQLWAAAVLGRWEGSLF